ncbi:Xaa-Pro peptidase family protein [Bacillus sp. B15-48]|uniref:M24 family metallopeptidase n=1 Tax=Bacillus sp. B15-48 TaxID=1548601 RepID=UPI00193F6849|nr:Xaa-Pro peptidase family protein [Bacillus sp. B15-48]MBM4762550.1 M24 family metallopeptidase [Bacillus sp. B15-48]
MIDRRIKLSAWLKENDIDVAFLTSPNNVFYFSQFLSDPHERLLGVAIFQEEEPFLICASMEGNEAKNAGWPHEIIGYSDIDDPWVLVKQTIKSRVHSVHKMAIEKEHMNIKRYEYLSELFAGTLFVTAEDKIRQLRLVKDQYEMIKLREACKLADYAVETGINEISERKTELEILAAIEYEMKKKGVLEMSFSTMVLTGKNSASPHGTPGKTKIQKGDLVLFDLGVVVDGYCSDITRTVAFHDLSEEQEKIYETVLASQLTALKKIKSGTIAADVDLAARNYIHSAGYGQYFPHRLGHGLGISVHEYPSITETNSMILEEGMVFTVEPGIYVPNVGGVRIEDDVVVTATGVESLTKYPKELQIIR